MTRCPLGWAVGPQLEVLYPVVQPIPISMMDYFIWQQGAAEVKSHHQSVLTHLGSPSNEVSKWSRDRDLSIAVADAPIAVAVSDRTIGQGVAVFEEALVVGGTEALGFVGLEAIINRAQPPLHHQGSFADLASS